MHVYYMNTTYVSIIGNWLTHLWKPRSPNINSQQQSGDPGEPMS